MASIDSEAPRRDRPIDLRQLISVGASGRKIFRLLVPNACRFSCPDCPLAAQSSLPRHATEPGYLARIFISAYRRGLCDGLFLMSGVPLDRERAMAALIEFVDLLRNSYGYRGYIHVKVPGGTRPPEAAGVGGPSAGSSGRLETLMRLVDRVSFQLDPACGMAISAELPQVRRPGAVAMLRSRRDRHEAPSLATPGLYQPYLLEVPRLEEGARGV